MAGVLLPTGGSYTVATDITGATPNYYGIESEAATTITNPGHSISGGSTTTGWGIFIVGGAGHITNETGGYISGYFGVSLTDGGSVANNSGATIHAAHAAVYSNLTASASVVNDGTITGAYDGVALLGGGSVTNDAGATITGTGHYGVYIGLGGSVTNAGSISGGTNAIAFGGSGANTLTLEGGSSLSGNAIGSVASGATNTLILEGIGSTSSVFNNFGTVEVDASANWTLSGASTFTETEMSGNNATLSLGGGSTTAVISGTSDNFTEVATGDTVTISGTGDTVTVTGDTVIISGTGDTVNGTGNTEIYAPTISGTVANQPTTSEAPVKPFSGVTIGDKTSGETDTDTLTITVGGVGGTLSGTGLVATSTAGVYTLSGTAGTITTELEALSFTPTAGAPNSSSTTTFKLSDVTSVYSTPTVDTTTSVVDTDGAVAPTITGTKAGQTTTSEAPIKPFSGATIGDKNASATDALTITLSGGGTLSGTGLSGGSGVYSLAAASAATITSELEGLTFTPVDGVPNTSVTTTFTLSDKSSAFGTAAVDSTTTVIDSDPAVAPTITGTVASQPTTSEAPVKPFSGATIADKNSGATDALTITLTGGGTLSGTVLSGGSGVYSLAAASAATITSELEGLTFTPVNGVPNTSVTTTFTLSDKSSAYGTATVNSTTTVIDTDPAGAPTITGTVANQTTTSEAPVNLFSGVAIDDANSGATDTLTITLGGTGGVLSGTGLSGGTGGVYTLSATASAITSELDALSFSPKAGAPTTTFELSDLSSAYATPTVNTTTSVSYLDQPSNDFTGSGTSDALLQNGGTLVDWILKNGQLTSGNVLGTGLTGWNVVGAGDFTGNGTDDVLLQNGGTIVDWIMKNGQLESGNVLGTGLTGWNVVGTGDFSGNGTDDVLLQNGGTLVDWTMKNGQVASGSVLGTGLTGWKVVGTGDFTGDGTDDVLLQNGGTIVDWIMKNGQLVSGNVLGTGLTGWKVVGTGDFTGNGTDDVLLQNGGTIVDWIMKSGQVESGNVLGTGLTGWNVVGTGDYNGDGTTDVLLQNGGTTVDWTMKNGLVSSGSVIATVPGWSVK